jgi:hypothetical protein
MKALIVLAGIYMVGTSFAVPIHSNNTTDPFEHGNNPWVQAAMDFGLDPTFAGLVSSSGGGGTASAVMCGNAWTTCADETYGPWQSQLAFCIDIYLCAYYECEQCDGAARIVCLSGAHSDLYTCSGIDLMALMKRWGLTHEEAVEVLRGMI